MTASICIITALHPATGTWNDVNAASFIKDKINSGWNGGTLVYRNLPHPSEFMLGACSRRINNLSMYGYWAFRPNRGFLEGTGGIALNHSGKANALRGDGHVAAQGAWDLRNGFMRIKQVAGKSGESILMP